MTGDDAGRLAPDGLLPLRAVIAQHGLSARKSLGQNFLFDLNLTRRIARAAAPLTGFRIIEVGPGPGGLTRALLAEGADDVVAIERDERFRPVLAEIANHWPGKLQVIEADALEFDPQSLSPRPAKVVANLPYNVGTALVARWLETAWPPWWSSLTVMLQKEVAERLAASPGIDSYGRLSVLAGWRAQVDLLFDVPPQAFVPPPQVTSTIVRLIPRPHPLAEAPLALLSRVTAAAFGQRRKMLRQSLKSLGQPVEPLLAKAGLDPTLRAERVDIAGFCALARALGDATASHGG